MSKPMINGKPVNFMGTSSWNQKYGGLECALYIREALEALAKKPVDMLVYEMPKPGVMQIRCAGYDLATQSKLDEKTVLLSTESLPIETFWLKLDDFGSNYVGTFLFPSEY